MPYNNSWTVQKKFRILITIFYKIFCSQTTSLKSTSTNTRRLNSKQQKKNILADKQSAKEKKRKVLEKQKKISQENPQLPVHYFAVFLFAYAIRKQHIQERGEEGNLYGKPKGKSFSDISQLFSRLTNRWRFRPTWNEQLFDAFSFLTRNGKCFPLHRVLIIRENEFKWTERKPKKSGRVASQHKLVNKLIAQLFSFLEESSKEVEQIYDEFVGANVLQVCSCQRSVDTTDDVTWNSINKADFFLYFLKSSANLWDYLLPVHISTCVVCWRAQTNSSTAQKATNAGWCHNQQRRKDNYKAHLSSNCATI